jgi:hypothetical protein
MKREMTRTDSQTQNLEAYPPAITGHCYRMLGSFFDAEDATQEADAPRLERHGTIRRAGFAEELALSHRHEFVSMRFTTGGGGRAPSKKARHFPAALHRKT